MSVNLTLLAVMGALYACGIYLILERSLTRVLLGLMLLANATNLLILATGGYAGLAPFYAKDTPAQDYSDPLPQALILTSIVISFAVTAFMLGIIYRTWVLARQDELPDDVEDRRVAETPSFDAEDDAEVPVETSEFPLTMLGGDGRSVSDQGPAPGHGTAEPGGTITAGATKIAAADAAAEEQPGSRNVTPGPEGGVK
jgi:multicomponent Na+:H+ antiporter subunit C